MTTKQQCTAYKTDGLVSLDPSLTLPIEIHTSGDYDYALAVYDGEEDVCYATLSDLIEAHKIDLPEGWSINEQSSYVYRGEPESWATEVETC